QSFQQLERAMGAIKSHRPFQQYRYSRNSVEAVLVGEMGRKCAIDGERNVKFYQTSQTEGNPMNVLRRKLHLLPDEVCLDPDIPRRYLQAGEGLSAVSFVKRCVHGKHIQQAFPDAQQAFLPPGIGTEVFDAFPSTAAIALQDVLDRIQQATSTDAQALLDFRRHLKHLPGTAGDEQLFYPENHTDAYFRKQQLFRTQNSSQRQQQLAAFESAYAPLNRSLQGLGLHCPSYYAMIRFDGDSMGKWLNGDPAFFQDSSRMETFHQLLSEHLGRFAAWAFDFLNLPAGKAIFAGGDDFLGFVNLDHLFPVLEQLREGFDRMVNQTLKKGLAADGSSVGDVGIRPERNLSFSAGLVVAHYKTPLSIVLQGVQQAEHQAKQFQNSKKDSLHLMILKKSGESLSASCPWYINQQLLSRNLQEIIETLRKPDGFSSSFLRTWYQHLRPMIDDRGKALPDLSEEMILIEGKRLLKRAWMGTSQEQELASQTFMDLLQPLLFYPAEIRNFFQLLFICDFIQRNTNGPRL
ncbi:MAG: type III-B CRISPR-associated protein Cas10/Cmr2, partial [Bacteroidota bacterium]